LQGSYLFANVLQAIFLFYKKGRGNPLPLVKFIYKRLIKQCLRLLVESG
jgi:hypothetical protein